MKAFASGHTGGFDEKHIPAGRGPGQAGCHAGMEVRATISSFPRKMRVAEQFLHVLWGYLGGLLLALRSICVPILRQTAPISRSRLRTPASRVVMADDGFQGFVGELRLLQAAAHFRAAGVESR